MTRGFLKFPSPLARLLLTLAVCFVPVAVPVASAQARERGGNPDLTDTEIERAITYMVNQSGGDWIEPVSKFDSVVERSGAEVVQTHCAKCHQDGVADAPRIGDRTAWIPRVKQGFELLVRSAIRGHGSMPSRGDAANLTDSEIRAAIAFMVNGDSVKP